MPVLRSEDGRGRRMSRYIDADEFVKDLERLCDIVRQYSKKTEGCNVRGVSVGGCV